MAGRTKAQTATANGAAELLFEDGDFVSYRENLPETVCDMRLPDFVRVRSLPPVEVQLDLDTNSAD